MKAIINGDHAPIYAWESEDNIEPQALQQVRNTASMPGIFHHVAVMPDVHFGKGATVGSVVATTNTICPACVGVDIGCGMQAELTNIHVDELEGKLPEIRSRIEADIPVGFSQHKDDQFDPVLLGFNQTHPQVQDLAPKVAKQLGTLGGGNHFIELCYDQDGRVWIMLHSGSRHIGKTLADIHIHEAKSIMDLRGIKLKDPDLAYLVEGTGQFKAYLSDLSWAQRYARANRNTMMEKVRGILFSMFLKESGEVRIDCHHNYVSEETHYGQRVYITRKGAVSAKNGQLGIIPGSMGTRSFIVVGKGEPQSFHSCSHGAGRRMSRGKARKTFNLADVLEQTHTVECRKDKDIIDELPGAYKPIEAVMENQRDLVSIVAELKQVLCVKG